MAAMAIAGMIYLLKMRDFDQFAIQPKSCSVLAVTIVTRPLFGRVEFYIPQMEDPAFEETVELDAIWRFRKMLVPLNHPFS